MFGLTCTHSAGSAVLKNVNFQPSGPSEVATRYLGTCSVPDAGGEARRRQSCSNALLVSILRNHEFAYCVVASYVVLDCSEEITSYRTPGLFLVINQSLLSNSLCDEKISWIFVSIRMTTVLKSMKHEHCHEGKYRHDLCRPTA